jgi:hypothetical protein
MLNRLVTHTFYSDTRYLKSQKKKFYLSISKRSLNYQSGQIFSNHFQKNNFCRVPCFTQFYYLPLNYY